MKPRMYTFKYLGSDRQISLNLNAISEVGPGLFYDETLEKYVDRGTRIAMIGYGDRLSAGGIMVDMEPEEVLELIKNYKENQHYDRNP